MATSIHRGVLNTTRVANAARQAPVELFGSSLRSLPSARCSWLKLGTDATWRPRPIRPLDDDQRRARGRARGPTITRLLLVLELFDEARADDADRDRADAHGVEPDETSHGLPERPRHDVAVADGGQGEAHIALGSSRSLRSSSWLPSTTYMSDAMMIRLMNMTPIAAEVLPVLLRDLAQPRERLLHALELQSSKMRSRRRGAARAGPAASAGSHRS